MLGGFAFNLAVVTELVDYFDSFMLNIMVGSSQQLVQLIDS